MLWRAKFSVGCSQQGAEGHCAAARRARPGLFPSNSIPTCFINQFVVPGMHTCCILRRTELPLALLYDEGPSLECEASRGKLNKSCWNSGLNSLISGWTMWAKLSIWLSNTWNMDCLWDKSSWEQTASFVIAETIWYQLVDGWEQPPQQPTAVAHTAGQVQVLQGRNRFRGNTHLS